MVSFGCDLPKRTLSHKANNKHAPIAHLHPVPTLTSSTSFFFRISMSQRIVVTESGAAQHEENISLDTGSFSDEGGKS